MCFDCVQLRPSLQALSTGIPLEVSHLAFCGSQLLQVCRKAAFSGPFLKTESAPRSTHFNAD